MAVQLRYSLGAAVRSAKAYFVASASLDKVPANLPGFDKPLGSPLPEAYVRITIGAGEYERIEVMEPRASKATANCLRNAVKAVAIPPESQPATIVQKFTAPAGK